MLTTTARLASLLLFLSNTLCTLHAQILGGYWVSSQGTGVGVTCHDAQTDLPATCVTHVYCTKPPNPIAAFDIGGQAYATCPNQPVRNVGLTVQKPGDAMTMAAEGKATATAYNRLIKDELRSGDCNGNTVVITNFTDPYGCDPPPPPPPPVCTCNPCTGFCTPTGCSCPIAIDVFNEGMHFTSLQRGVPFDFNGNGKPLFMAWTDRNYHNAWLALDRNHNGRIDSAQELFGYPTQPQVPGPTPNGWLALAVYDEPAYGGNGDGVIDAKDAIYPELLLWIDANHDGISQPNEVHHLAELSVTSIELKYKDGNSYTDNNGNQFKFESFVDVGPIGDDRLYPDRQAWDVVLKAVDGGAASTPIPLCIPR